MTSNTERPVRPRYSRRHVRHCQSTYRVTCAAMNRRTSAAKSSSSGAPKNPPCGIASNTCRTAIKPAVRNLRCMRTVLNRNKLRVPACRNVGGNGGLRTAGICSNASPRSRANEARCAGSHPANPCKTNSGSVLSWAGAPADLSDERLASAYLGGDNAPPANGIPL